MRNNNFTGHRVDIGSLPRFTGSNRNAEIWKFKINDWFKKEGITTDEDKFSYIIMAAEDDIVKVIMEKVREVNRTLTLDECVVLIKKRYWRENQRNNNYENILQESHWKNKKSLNNYKNYSSN
ncbi:hypothetical protein H8356DRAFT_924392, partial [Neocallimastix lanati (nom. inval.)]